MGNAMNYKSLVAVLCAMTLIAVPSTYALEGAAPAKGAKGSKGSGGGAGR